MQVKKFEAPTLQEALDNVKRELGPEARLALYRTAQEALTNIRRHATAGRVDLSVDYRADDTVLVVEDHAVPGSPSPAPVVLNGGYGLTGMRERAEMLGDVVQLITYGVPAEWAAP